jgi:glycerophosphoryl diester phosphodiesterase
MAVLFALIMQASNAAGQNLTYHNDIRNRQCCLVIAHAAGGIDGNPYTNSQESLQGNLALGSRVFEIDFSKTRDGEWVATHDWENWRRQTGYSGTIPTFAEFISFKLKPFEAGAIANQYTPLTLDYLEKVVIKQPDIVIVTDTKYDFREMVMFLSRSTLHNNLYYQAYSFEDVDFLAQHKISKIILTIYKMNVVDVDQFVDKVNAVAGKITGLTMPVSFYALHSAKFSNIKLPIYLHGGPGQINSRELHVRMKKLGVAGFYLD